MKKKIMFSFLLLALVLGGLSFAGAANAQTVSFPAGCASGIGYSATTGQPCSGTSTVNMGISGCTTPLGYSATTGTPCSGTSTAISFLAGCTNTFGYSAITGQPCNGTTVASVATGTGSGTSLGGTVIGGSTSTPGLPRTGEDGNAVRNIMILLGAITLTILGSTVLFKVEKLS